MNHLLYLVLLLELKYLMCLNTFDEEFTREFMAYDTDKGIVGLIAILKKRP